MPWDRMKHAVLSPKGPATSSPSRYNGCMRVVLAGGCTYAETNYANPHALTATSTAPQPRPTPTTTTATSRRSTGAATSTYTWDYRNRMISAWVSGATSTYAYDHTIARMAQRTSTTTSHYPNKFYSIDYAAQFDNDSDEHGVHLARRHARRVHRAAHRERPGDRHADDVLRASRSPGLDERRHERERHRRGDARLLPVRCGAHPIGHGRSRPHVHRAIRR